VALFYPVNMIKTSANCPGTAHGFTGSEKRFVVFREMDLVFLDLDIFFWNWILLINNTNIGIKGGFEESIRLGYRIFR